MTGFDPKYFRLAKKTKSCICSNIGHRHSQFNNSSAVPEMGDRDHSRHGPKRGGCYVPFAGEGDLVPRLTQCGLGRGLLPYQVTSSSIQPFGHNRYRPKTGGRGRAPFRRELRLHLTQRRLGRGLPPYQVASWSIQPFGHNTHGPKIGGLCPPFWDGEPVMCKILFKSILKIQEKKL